MECSGRQKYKCHAFRLLWEGNIDVARKDRTKQGNSQEKDDGSKERASTKNSSSQEELELSDDGIEVYDKPQSNHLPFSIPKSRVVVRYKRCIFKE